jgi:hypothetical protein
MAPVRGRYDKTTSSYPSTGATTAWRAGRLVNNSGVVAVRQCTTSGEQVDGFFLFDGVDGDLQTLASQGSHKCETGGAFNPGDQLMTDTSGRMVVYAAATGKSVAGVAEEISAGAGAFVIVRHGNTAAAAG